MSGTNREAVQLRSPGLALTLSKGATLGLKKQDKNTPKALHQAFVSIV
jgi:hypothetical protein